MPVSARTSATGSARGRATAAASAPDAGRPELDRAMQLHNEKVGLSFRKKVAAYVAQDRATQRVIQSYAKSFGKSQITVQIVEDLATGETGIVELHGATKNIPRSLRMKRTAADAQVDDEEDEEEDGVGNGNYDDAEMNGGEREMANEWTEEEAREAARLAARRKKAAAASSAKKQKKSSSSRRAAPRDSGPHESAGPAATGAARPAGNSDATGTTTARRSSRVTRSTRPSSTSNREPIIREDAEENHVRNDNIADGEAPHHIDEYHLRRSTRAASDDLNSLSDRMNLFEIKSEAGSESTRVFSRESSLAEPVASTSRL